MVARTLSTARGRSTAVGGGPHEEINNNTANEKLHVSSLKRIFLGQGNLRGGSHTCRPGRAYGYGPDSTHADESIS